MYTQQEASLVRKKFWTSFGLYMMPVPSAFNTKVNWVNYRTGVKGVRFKTDVDNNRAYIAIEVSGLNRERLFNAFLNMKEELDAELTWDFDNAYHNGSEETSAIYAILEPVNVFRETDWPQIISFFKSRLVILDGFWANNKEIFELLN